MTLSSVFGCKHQYVRTLSSLAVDLRIAGHTSSTQLRILADDVGECKSTYQDFIVLFASGKARPVAWMCHSGCRQPRGSSDRGFTLDKEDLDYDGDTRATILTALRTYQR